MTKGRKPAPPVQLPGVEPEASAIADWLQKHEPSQRRPDATAKVLALAVKLYLDGKRPWPTRQQVCSHLGVSLPMIDVVMSQRQATKDITVWTATAPGNIKKHASVITQKFIKPAPALIKAATINTNRR